MSRIFISFSKDFDIALKLQKSLEMKGFDIWIYLEDIPPTVDWLEEIYQGIEKSDIFLFLISPDSIISDTCQKEINHAVLNGKRIIPLVVRKVNFKIVRKEIARLQAISFEAKDGFDLAFTNLLKAIETDFSWVQFHTNLQEKALNWERHKDTSRLLRGKELRDAEELLAEVGSEKDPQPTKLQRNYILIGRKHENQLRQRTIFGLGIGLVIMVILSFIAWDQRNNAMASEETAIAEANARATAQKEAEIQADIAEERRKLALARQIAVQAELTRTGQPDHLEQSVLLAAESLQRFQELGELSSQVNQTLREGLSILPQHILDMYHPGVINSLTASQDGKWIATSILDPMQTGFPVMVWRLPDGENVYQLETWARVTDLDFSPDSQYLATAGSHGIAQVWNLADGEEVVSLEHGYYMNDIAFSPDGNFLVTAGQDGNILIWNWQDPRPRPVHLHQDDSVIALAFSPNGQFLATASMDETIRIWDVPWGPEIGRMAFVPGPDAFIHFFSHNPSARLAFSPDNSLLAVGGYDGQVQIWDLANRQELSSFRHENAVTAVSFSPRGDYLASASVDETARVWQLNSGREYLRLKHTDDVNAVVFSKSGKFVVTASADGTARVWETQQGTEFTRMTHDASVESVVLSPDGVHAITIGGSTASLWEMTNQRELKFFNFAAFAVSPDNEHFVGASGRATTTVYGIASGNKGRSVNHDGDIGDILFAPDGKWVATSDGYTVKVWDITSESKIYELAHSRVVWRIAFSPDGKLLGTASSPRDGYTLIRIWNWAEEKEISQFKVQGSPGSIMFSEDSNYLAVTAFTSEANLGFDTAWLFETTSGQEAKHIPLHGGERALIYNLIDNRLSSLKVVPESFTREQDKIIIVYFPSSPSLSPDGRYRLTYTPHTTLPNTLRVEEIATGEVVFQTELEPEIVEAVFSPNGRFLVTLSWSFYISDNRYVRFWLWRPQDLIEAACSRVLENLTQSEWMAYIGEDIPYHATCPNHSIPNE